MNTALVPGMPKLPVNLSYERVGGVLALCLTLVFGAVALTPQSQPEGRTRIVIETLTVGRGVGVDSDVILRGVPVGTVNSIELAENGGSRLELDVESASIASLTDSLTLDYVPFNYFGIAAVRLLPEPGGQGLHDGVVLVRQSIPDNTMGALVEGSGSLTTRVLNSDLTDSINRMAVYSDVAVPVIDSVISAVRIRDAEWARPLPQELAAFADVAGQLPDFVANVLDAQATLVQLPRIDDIINKYEPINETMKLIGTGFFGPVGLLLSSHRNELTPTTEMASAVAGYFADIVHGAQSVLDMREALARAASAVTGPAESPSAHLRVILQGSPALASSVGGVR
ncbi:MlaD family protein [Gordonia sp. MP11Mi]|uniref:Mce/MlaD domain-containing protein n=1 Tax=Gordonia sp. MP11Mi TaxID=3022769 RepID=A0AA97CYV3_9ACTN